ncbi:MAG TPA: hypothetical protein GXX75_11980 [Clostridiales bacterium]|nr:hypothetical protein [Clostridiales bacterium]
MNKSVFNIFKLITMPVLLFIVFSIISPGFGVHSLPIVISQSMIPMMMALGMYVVMDAGLMDFSIGARAVFAAIAGGMLSQYIGVAGLILGCFLGAMFVSTLMAALYRWLKIPCMVISIGILMVFEVAGSKLVGSSGYLRISAAQSSIASYPFNVIITLAVGVFAYILYYRTRIGNHITAVGNDEKMCKNLGIDADKTKFYAIVLTGVFCTFVALLYICYSGSITAGIEMTSMAMIFEPIMCVILGRHLRKYVECMPLLILVGAFSITIIFNGFIALGFSDAVQNIVLGVFLIVILGSDVITDKFSILKLVKG